MSATSGYDENELLWDILGPPEYNNLDEPIPWSNKKSTLMGLTITFMVRLDYFSTISSRNFCLHASLTVLVVVFCQFQIIRAI